jgi:hypothetical protein
MTFPLLLHHHHHSSMHACIRTIQRGVMGVWITLDPVVNKTLETYQLTLNYANASG